MKNLPEFYGNYHQKTPGKNNHSKKTPDICLQINVADLRIIRIIGREEYKKTYFNKNLEHDFTFIAIEHQDISINLEVGFFKWKKKLEELLS